ncbi:hypothetical protein A3K73_06235 [Candidatus Pacearchaeota archaeon RBG_13_36_9]|nr:MAG: hypothetical protein A3K73_06235 [Candidatus Pacearchaeota archaeon RBG_13_36_9]
MEIKINNLSKEINAEVIRDGVFVDLISLSEDSMSVIMGSVSGFTKLTLFKEDKILAEDFENCFKFNLEIYDLGKKEIICIGKNSYLEGEGDGRTYTLCFRDYDSVHFNVEVHFKNEADKKNFLKVLKDVLDSERTMEKQKERSIKTFFENAAKGKVSRDFGIWIITSYINTEKEKDTYNKINNLILKDKKEF